MLAHSVVVAVSIRRRRSEIDATIRARGERRYGQRAGTYVVLYTPRAATDCAGTTEPILFARAEALSNYGRRC